MWRLLFATIVLAVLTPGAVIGQCPPIHFSVTPGIDGDSSFNYGPPPKMSADGRFVAFLSPLMGLVPEDTNNRWDAFVLDRQTNVLKRVSATADGLQSGCTDSTLSMSDDGRYIAFVSYMILPGDTNDSADAMYVDRFTDALERIAQGPNGEQAAVGSGAPFLSADGQYAVFYGLGAGLVPGPATGYQHIYLRDQQTREITRISQAPDGSPGNAGSSGPFFSADGRVIAFTSSASNLAPNDTNGLWDGFLFDRTTGILTRIMGPNGEQPTSEVSIAGLTADSREVLISSYFPFVADDTWGFDHFVFDRQTGSFERVSLGLGGAQADGLRNGASATISRDGRWIAFNTASTNVALADTNDWNDLFLHDRQTGLTRMLTRRSDGEQVGIGGEGGGYIVPAFSPDGNWITFRGYGSILEPPYYGGQPILYDLQRDIRITSLPGNIVAPDGGPATLTIGAESDSPPLSYQWRKNGVAISDDGNVSGAQTSTLSIGAVEPENTGAYSVVMTDACGRLFEWGSVHIRPRCATGPIQCLSRRANGVFADRGAASPRISSTGQHVVFRSTSTNLVDGIANGLSQIYLRDLDTGVLAHISRGLGGGPADDGCGSPTISSDGTIVVFSSSATNLVPDDTNGQTDIFVADLTQNEITRVLANSGAEPNGSASAPVVSADGQSVAFQSAASNLIDGDTNGQTDVFVFHRPTGQARRVSLSSSGVQGDLASTIPAISSDGTRVVFVSAARNLVPNDTNQRTDAFVHDIQTGSTSCVSIDAAGIPVGATAVDLSADGRHVAFLSSAATLVPGDTNTRADAFVRDLQLGITERVSFRQDGGELTGQCLTVRISPDGRIVGHVVWLEPEGIYHDLNAKRDVFLFDRATSRTTLASVAVGGGQGNEESDDVSLSEGARRVVFWSRSSNLITSPISSSGVFLLDRLAHLHITANPLDRTTAIEQAVSFTILLDTPDTSISYAWRLNGTAISDDGRITGSQSPTLLIDPLQLADGGEYDCIVTDRCGNSVTSEIAVLDARIMGDINGDCSVDIADLAVLLANFATLSGASFVQGDFDGDSDVDLSDLALLLSQFSAMCP